MSEREEFVSLLTVGNTTMAELCRRFGVAPKTGHKWLNRFNAGGRDALRDQSRRPLNSPKRSTPEVESAVLTVRQRHPAWGGRKIRWVLQNEGFRDVPAASTITAILHRHGCIDPAESAKHSPCQRFEHPFPNDLWQMDFKGHFPMRQGRCHALTVLDDHSRYCLGLRACGNERSDTVQEQLISIFRRYGLPRRILADNGSPWGDAWESPHTRLTVWLLRLDIPVPHGRPYHPQTQGKDERFHRTLNAELLRHHQFDDLADCQRGFDDWRSIYNRHRPHEALDMDPPARRYQPSPRAYLEVFEPIEYGPGLHVRKVQQGGVVHFRNREFRIGKAFYGQPVGFQPTLEDGVFHVYFCRHPIARINLKTGTTERGRQWMDSHSNAPPRSSGEPSPKVPPNPLLGLHSPPGGRQPRRPQSGQPDDKTPTR